MEMEKCIADLGWIQSGDNSVLSLAQDLGHGLYILRDDSSECLFSFTCMRCKLLHNDSIIVDCSLPDSEVFV